MIEQSRVFVAGSDDMIGQALVRSLHRQGFKAVIGESPDLHDASAVDRFFKDTRPEYVVVAAGQTAGIVGNQRHPADLMLDNLLVTTHLISSAWRHSAAKLLYLSSSCTYPRLASQPLAVESLWTGPVEPTSDAYAVAKLAGMRLCEAYRRQYGAAFITAIKAEVFGPGDDFDPENSHVASALLRRMHEAKLASARVVDIWGTGTPRREFIYVDDLAEAVIFLMQNYDAAEPINIGTGATTSIRELAEVVRDVVGYIGELQFDTSRPDGMPLKGLDSSPLRALGWKPSWELKPALEKTYEWFLSNSEGVNVKR